MLMMLKAGQVRTCLYMMANDITPIFAKCLSIIITPYFLLFLILEKVKINRALAYFMTRFKLFIGLIFYTYNFLYLNVNSNVFPILFKITLKYLPISSFFWFFLKFSIKYLFFYV